MTKAAPSTEAIEEGWLRHLASRKEEIQIVRRA